MALLAGRIGRDLEGPVYAEYYRILNGALTTEQFFAATQLAFATWDGAFRNWPSPQQLIEMITPVAAPGLSAAEAFEKVLGITNDPRIAVDKRKEMIQALGASVVRAYHASGGRREFENALESNVTWLRKTFVAEYERCCENAEAERAATLALSDADLTVQQLVAKTAGALTADPKQRKQITTGSAA